MRELGGRFDVVLCFGILHRVTDPIRLRGHWWMCWPRAARSCSKPTAHIWRLLKLESVEQQMRDGSLVIRAMTPEERKKYPKPGHPRPQRRRT